MVTPNNAMQPAYATFPVPVFLHCIIAAGVPQPGSLGLRPNPTVVHITLCEFFVFWSLVR